MRMIKDHRVRVSLQDGTGIDAQSLLLKSEGKTVCQKTARPFTHEETFGQKSGVVGKPRHNRDTH